MAVEIFNRVRNFNKFRPESKFLVIGNDIDGKVNVGIKEFTSFEELKIKLPEIIKKLKFEGEWVIELYQIPDNYQIIKQYGYYKVPKPAKKVLKINYMDVEEANEILISDALIHFKSRSNYFEDLNREGRTIQKIHKNFITVHLNQGIEA